MAEIVIIDDSESIHKIVCVVLESKGYEVQSYLSAEEAIFKLGTPNDTKLILLDIMMPGLDGFDFLSASATDLLAKGIKICCLTGKNSPEDVQKALKFGVSDYILKPIKVPILIEKVETLIGPANNPA